MAELTIHLLRPTSSGVQEIVIDLESAQDAMPHEHEALHSEAVAKMFDRKNYPKLIMRRPRTNESG